MNRRISKVVGVTLALLLISGIASAQQPTVSGTVADSTGNSLPGVNIKVKGTTTGTSTDSKGQYSLEVPSLQDTLVFSFIGYQKRIMPIDGRTTINTTLKSQIISGEQMVVVGFGKQKKENLTGAVAQINGSELASRPITNLVEGLQGLVPNLNVNLNNGEPGQESSFNIRGKTSINGGSPLILVDGVEMNPNLINSDNIKSVTVLKDAAASAIYGGRAAYGVILIKTKTPQNKGMRVTYSGSVTMNRPSNLPDYLNSVNYVNMHRAANRNGKRTGGYTSVRPFTKKDSIKTLQYYRDPQNNSPVYVDPSSPKLYQYVGNTDWPDVEYPGYAPQSKHNLTVSGGNGTTSYLGSVGYFYQKGTAKPTNETYQRFNPTIKLNSAVTSWLNLNFKATFHHTKRDKPTENYISGPTSLITSDVRPVMPVRHPDGHFSGQGQYTNMVAVANKNGRRNRQVNDLWLTGGINFNPVEHLNIRGKLNWNSYRTNTLRHWKEWSEYGANGAFIDHYPWTIPNAIEKNNEHDNYTKINLRAQYENTFGKHYIKGLVGYNQELKKINGFSARANSLINQDLPTIGLNYDSKPSVGDQLSSWALVGYFFRLNYRYKNKYLFEINGRYDGSSRFPPNNRYEFTPSVSAGWRISQEKFFSPIKHIINSLKIRVSYGRLGNQTLSADFPYLATLPTGTTDYIFGNQTQPYAGAAGLVNSNFTWEKVYSKDAGINFSMFQDRLSATFNYYIRNTKNMLVAGQPLPAVLGTSAPRKNAANLKTQGWGLNIGWQERFNKDLSFNISLNLSNSNSHITKYDLNPNKLVDDYYPGYRFGQIYGYVTDGFFQTNQEAEKADQSQLYGGQWIAGDIRYKDLNGDGKITPGNNTVADPGDRKIIGNSTPHYKFGLNFSVNYKNFDFNTFLQGVGKRDFMPGAGNSYFWGFTSEWTVPTVGNKDYWTPQNRDAYFPALRFGGGGDYKPQTKYLQNAAYMRVKYITLGYTLPSSLLKNTGVHSLRIYATGKNLFTLTNLYSPFDPELLSATTYPVNKAYSFGLKVQF